MRIVGIAVVAAVLQLQRACAQEVRVGVNLPYTGVARRNRPADGSRHGALSQAQCRQGQAVRDQADQARREKSRRRRRQGRGAGTADPGQCRHRRRLALFAERDCDRAAGHRRQEARRDHECRHRAHHQSLALLCAGLVQHVARRRCAGRRRGETTRRQDRRHRLQRLPARQGQPRCVQARLRGGRRHGDRRHPDGGGGGGAGLHAVLPARQGQEAGRVLRVRAVAATMPPRSRGPMARSACGRPGSS